MKVCWSDKAVKAADGTWDVKTVHTALQNLKGVNGSIIAAFQQVGEGRVTYSHHQHTMPKAQYAKLIYSFAQYLKHYWQYGVHLLGNRKQQTI